MASKSSKKGKAGAAADATRATRQRTREESQDAWQERFIAALRNSGNVRASCQAAGVERSTAYRAYQANPDFAVQWNGALEEAVDTLEAAAWTRARDGVVRRKPIMYQGQKVSEEVIVEYSDTVLITLLKAHRPEKYRERFDIQLKDAKTLAEDAIAECMQKTGKGRVEAIELLKPFIPEISSLIH